MKIQELNLLLHSMKQPYLHLNSTFNGIFIVGSMQGMDVPSGK